MTPGFCFNISVTLSRRFLPRALARTVELFGQPQPPTLLRGVRAREATRARPLLRRNRDPVFDSRTSPHRDGDGDGDADGPAAALTRNYRGGRRQVTLARRRILTVWRSSSVAGAAPACSR